MTEESQLLIWQADVTHPKLADDAKEALREVIDPEIGLNIIELGLIRDVTINDSDVHVNMILTTPYCPYGPALLEMARKKVEESLNLTTTIEIGMQMWEPSLMEEGVGADWGLF
ncbi:MAG: iron-sulfur cluster assembly protein [Anaerolineales bacterium]|jgi:metal-sulfur cluster biosynthetic enzyme|nr:iron-sulfur cluster assembly protein [Anaerolineales bacterium]